MRTLTRPVALTGNRDWDVQVIDSTRVVLTPTASGTAQRAQGRDGGRPRRRPPPDRSRRAPRKSPSSPRATTGSSSRCPGVEDPEALKKLIGQTARLEFKLVDLSANPQDVQQGRAPPGSQVLPMADGSGSIAVKRRVMVSGDQLTDAKQGFDQDGRPDINIKFNTSGARRFGRVTQENVGKPFAIILDDKVLSAPNINEPILGGQAQISGSFTVQSAHDLAVSLASGKLPVKLNVIEERTVGPDLGKDSIHKGVIASLVGTLGVVIFMLVTYGRFGVYANIALVVNAFLILGIMAMFNATLTLPGIAGFMLTIGAAVDANVLINERIREEIRRGRRLIDAVETGYQARRCRAIFDANVTHVISAGDHGLFRLGPGPRLRGRAADRHRHLGVHRGLFHPHAGRAVDPPRPAARAAYLRLRSMKLLKLVPDHTNLDFMRWRNLALVLSLIATVASLAFTVYRGLNLGVDFVGGQMIRVDLRAAGATSSSCAPRSTSCSSAKPASRSSAAPKTYPDPPAQAGRAATPPRTCVASRVKPMIETDYPGARIDSVDTVSGKVSEELADNSAMAIALRDARDRGLHLVPVRMAVRRRARC